MLVDVFICPIYVVFNERARKINVRNQTYLYKSKFQSKVILKFSIEEIVTIAHKY